MAFNLIWKCAMNAVLQNKQGLVWGFFGQFTEKIETLQNHNK